jgi:beta-lactamase superfamily II metal-dependent hydrolase
VIRPSVGDNNHHLQLIASLLLVAAIVFVLSPEGRAQDESELQVIFVPVDEGDAILYRGACGEYGLIDASWKSDNLLLIEDAFTSFGVDRLEWIAVSHYDEDHLGNVKALGERYAPVTIYDRGGGESAKPGRMYEAYSRWLSSDAQGNAFTPERHALQILETFALCSESQTVTFTVVSVGTDGEAAGGVDVSGKKEENNRGLCLKVEYRDFDLATCGDIGGGLTPGRGNAQPSTVDVDGRQFECFVKQRLRPATDVETPVAPGLGNVEFAKVNHHGSPTSSNLSYVSSLDAQASVIQGSAARFRHPNCTVVRRWSEGNRILYSPTNPDGSLKDGTVTVTTSGVGDFAVTTSESDLRRRFPMDEIPETGTDSRSLDGGAGMEDNQLLLLVGILVGALLVVAGGVAGQAVVMWSGRHRSMATNEARRLQRQREDTAAIAGVLKVLGNVPAHGDHGRLIPKSSSSPVPWGTLRQSVIGLRSNYVVPKARELSDMLIRQLNQLSEDETRSDAPDTSPGGPKTSIARMEAGSTALRLASTILSAKNEESSAE